MIKETFFSFLHYISELGAHYVEGPFLNQWSIINQSLRGILSAGLLIGKEGLDQTASFILGHGFVVVKEHQNLENGSPPEALTEGLAADIGQFSPLDPASLEQSSWRMEPQMYVGTEQGSCIASSNDKGSGDPGMKCSFHLISERARPIAEGVEKSCPLPSAYPLWQQRSPHQMELTQ